MIFLLAVSHAFARKDLLEKFLLTVKPDAVAVELDFKRYLAIKKRQVQGFFSLIRFGLFFSILSFLQKRIAQISGEFPGEEMALAVDLARKLNIPYYFVDDPVEILARRLKQVSMFEKLRFFLFSLRRNVRSLEEALLLLKNDFPGIYRVIVEERNQKMAKRIAQIPGCVAAVVGAAHAPGLKRELEKYGKEVEVVELFPKDLLG